MLPSKYQNSQTFEGLTDDVELPELPGLAKRSSATNTTNRRRLSTVKTRSVTVIVRVCQRAGTFTAVKIESAEELLQGAKYF